MNTKSVVVRGLTFSIGDRVRYTRGKGIYAGVINAIDPLGVNGSHLYVNEDGTKKLSWIHDNWIIIPENPTLTIFKLKNNPPQKNTPVSFWCDKVVLYRETPVTIKREVYFTSEKPYAEGYDAEGRYYKFRLDSLRRLDNAIEGVVTDGRK